MALQRLETIVSVIRNSSPQLVDLVSDASRFLLAHKPIVESVPLQIYAPALIFSPLRSLVRQTFIHLTSEWFIEIVGIDDDWSSCIQMVGRPSFWEVCEGSVVFAADGKQVATASSFDGLKSWEVATGSRLCTLKHFPGNQRRFAYDYSSVTYSPDGQWVAAKTDGGVIVILDAGTKDLVKVLGTKDDSIDRVKLSALTFLQLVIYSRWFTKMLGYGRHRAGIFCIRLEALKTPVL